MKISRQQEYDIKMTYVEMCAIYKLIGNTSETTRMDLEKFNMTKEESDAASKIYDAMTAYFDRPGYSY